MPRSEGKIAFFVSDEERHAQDKSYDGSYDVGVEVDYVTASVCGDMFLHNLHQSSDQ